ncbi:hypothetical protein QE430_001054 [Microbacterium testaceum]|uniref:DUF4012 domain-containing protein n=1 Tax=Microbacterium testaceum TaxID=2033 RepID=UPI0027897E91|nr:DUF4012 domain-containing protein [Microbacterium testaceum]MDQ1172747.1 hypothetical protein [Microbacterium testaceum]
MGERLRRDARSQATRGDSDLDVFDSTPTDAPPRRSRYDDEDDAPRRRVWPWVVGGVFGVVGGAAAFAGILGATLAVQALEVRDDLLAAKSSISSLGPLAEARDEAGLQQAAADLSERTSRAAATVNTPLWDMASQFPVVGVNIDAVSRVTRAADILVQDALPPGIQLLAQTDLSKLTLDGGGINLQPFVQAQDALPAMSQAFSAAKAETDGIDSDQLLSPVSGPVDEIRDVVDRAAPALDIANRYLPTLLDIAGANGPKKYLVVFQNNAESRATGGNPSANIIMDVDQGAFSLLDQGGPSTFYGPEGAGVQFTDLPAETMSLYPSSFAHYSQDNTMTPDFPTTAQLFSDAYTEVNGGRFDGVISIDPVVLSHMLQVAGPVDVAGQQINGDNAVKVLLSDAYQKFPTARSSDAFFAAVSDKVFRHLTSTKWDPTKMLDALTQSAEEKRINLSFTSPEAQQLVTEVGLDGGLRTDNTVKTQVGTYLNDYSVGKLEYYLTQSVSAVCDPTARTITTTTTLSSSVPTEGRSDYTLGERNAANGLPATSMMLNVLFFAPPGGELVSTDPASSDRGGFDRSGTEKGNTAVNRLVVLPTGETRTLTSTVKLPDGPLGPLELRHSPTATDTSVTVDASCGSLFGQ